MLTGKDRGSIFDAITPRQLELALHRKILTDVLAGKPRRVIEPGYWLIRLGGYKTPAVPACIRWVHTTHEPGLPENVMERSRFLAAFIKDEPVGFDEVLGRHLEKEITADEYRYHVDNARWAKAYAPREAMTRPRQRVDWFDQPPPF